MRTGPYVIVPSDCSQVRRALRSAHAVAAGGQDRRTLGLSTGLLAAIAANRNAAGRPGSRPIATCPVADAASGADTASGADATLGAAVTGPADARASRRPW